MRPRKLLPTERPWPARTDLHATGPFEPKAAVAAIARSLIDARGRCTMPTGVTHGIV